MKNEIAIYHILLRRGKLFELSYDEYYEAAKEVVVEIPEEVVILLEDMLNRIEEKVLARRKVGGSFNLFLGPKKSHA